jgi:hypothetical protein
MIRSVAPATSANGRLFRFHPISRNFMLACRYEALAHGRSDPPQRFVLHDFFLCPNSAQFSKLDDASAQMAKRLKPLKPGLVAVADFSSPDGSALSQSH